MKVVSLSLTIIYPIIAQKLSLLDSRSSQYIPPSMMADHMTTKMAEFYNEPYDHEVNKIMFYMF